MQIPVYEWKIEGADQENPVVPFRQKAISSTTPRKLSENRQITWHAVYEIAMSQTGGDKDRSKQLADAFIAGSDLRKQIHRKKNLVPFKHNPPVIHGKIYSRCLEIRASKAGIRHKCDATCRAAGHRFKHPFKQTACIYALSDGSILIK